MSFNIIDLVKSQISPALTSQAATQLGESESGITKAISGFLPLLLGGVLGKTGSSSTLDSLKNLAGSGILSNLGLGTGTNSGITSILSSLFGDKLGGIVSTVSSFAGIKETSAQSVLGLASGATFGSLGKYASENNLDSGSFGKLLEDQKSNISGMLPAGLSLGALGLGSLGLGSLFGGAKDAVGSVAGAVGGAAGAVGGAVSDTFSSAKKELSGAASSLGNAASNLGGQAPKGGGSFLRWLLPLVLLGLAAWFLLKKCGGKAGDAVSNGIENVGEATGDLAGAAVAGVDSLATGTANAVGDAANAVKEAITLDLNGVAIKANKGGIEDKMITFAKSDEYKTATEDQLKKKWFDFDGVEFEYGKTDKLKAGSQAQLENIAAILKAYKDAKIKIGAYSDKKGDDAANKALSQKRADHIKAELAKLGVAAQITGAEGYGEEFAKVAETATDDQRASDRKMAVRFAK